MADHGAALQLRNLTYERQDTSDFSIDLKTLERSCPLAQPSDIEGLNLRCVHPLGQLDRLPLELIHNILQLLDIHTLTLMQSLNHRSKLLVESLPEHREIVNHVPNALRALFSTGLAPHFTLLELRRELRAQKCFVCGSFGAYLYLPQCRRCCLVCLTGAFDVLPIAPSSPTAQMGFLRDVVCQLPRLYLLPITRTLNWFNGVVPLRMDVIIGEMAAINEGTKWLSNQEGQEAQEAIRAALEFQFETRFRRPTSNRYADGRNRKPFVASIRFPTLDASTRTVEWGLSCRGCFDGLSEDDQLKDWQVMYTERGYLAHFEHCERSKDLLESLRTDDSMTMPLS